MDHAGRERHFAARWLWPLAGVIFCLALGTASGLSSVGGGGDWYRSLSCPPGTPPPAVFGPVWSILYMMMGAALGRLIHRRASIAVIVFFLQFALNLAWTPVFFGAHRIGAALVVIGLIWLGLIATIIAAKRKDRVSPWLLYPYLAWVTYASYLNAGFFWLNS